MTQEEAMVREMIEVINKERQIPVEIPHHSPYISGHNSAIDYIITTIIDIATKYGIKLD